MRPAGGSPTRHRKCGARSTPRAASPTSWWKCCATAGYCAPAHRRRSADWSCRRRSGCARPRKWRAATRRPAGACRSGSPAACSSRTCRRRAATELFGDGRRPGRGRVGSDAARRRSVARRRGGVGAVGVLQRHHVTPTCCSPAAMIDERTRPVRRSRCQRKTSRSWTPGTRSACAAPAVTTPSPTTSSCPPTGSCSRCSTGRSSTVRCTASPVRVLRAVDRGAGAGQRARRDRRARRHRRREEGRRRDHARWPERSPTQAAVATAESALAAAAGCSTTRRSTPRGRRPARRARVRRAAQRLRLAATHAVRTSAEVVRAMYDLAGRQRDLRRLAAATALPRRVHRHRALPGQRGVARAPRPHPAGPARRHHDAVSCRIEGVLPFWLDRPDIEALDIARTVRRRCVGRLVDRRDGDVRRVRVGHRDRPSRAGFAA